MQMNNSTHVAARRGNRALALSLRLLVFKIGLHVVAKKMRMSPQELLRYIFHDALKTLNALTASGLEVTLQRSSAKK